MEKSLHYDMLGGHLLVEHDDRRFLLDTGAPCSVGVPLLFSLMGREHILHDRCADMTAESLSDCVGVRVDGLLGADILNQYDIIIDPEAFEVHLSTRRLRIDGENLTMDTEDGIPFVTAFTDGTPVKMFLDTGARLSYLPLPLSRRNAPVRISHDYYPRVGLVRAVTYRVKLVLGNDLIETIVGSLPSSMRRGQAARAEGILGTALLLQFIVCSSPRRNTLTLKRIPAENPAYRREKSAAPDSRPMPAPEPIPV